MSFPVDNPEKLMVNYRCSTKKLPHAEVVISPGLERILEQINSLDSQDTEKDNLQIPKMEFLKRH